MTDKMREALERIARELECEAENVPPAYGVHPAGFMLHCARGIREALSVREGNPPPKLTEEEIAQLHDALEQALDDMQGGCSVCLATKNQMIAALTLLRTGEQT